MNSLSSSTPIILPSPEAEGQWEWYREHFLDHPQYKYKITSTSGESIRDPSSMKGDKVKVICRLCLQHRIATIHAEDQHALSYRFY